MVRNNYININLRVSIPDVKFSDLLPKEAIYFSHLLRCLLIPLVAREWGSLAISLSIPLSISVPATCDYQIGQHQHQSLKSKLKAKFLQFIGTTCWFCILAPFAVEHRNLAHIVTLSFWKGHISPSAFRYPKQWWQDSLWFLSFRVVRASNFLSLLQWKILWWLPLQDCTVLIHRMPPIDCGAF